MIGLLGGILGGIAEIGTFFIAGVTTFANALIVALGAMIGVVVALLPSFPSPPAAPDGGVLGDLNWFVPLGPLLTTFALLVTVWIVGVGIRIMAGWAKIL